MQAEQTPQEPPEHGEGNYRAGRRYNDATKSFVDEGKVEPAADKAAPDTPQEASELEAAEREGRSHSKGEDRSGRTPDPKG
jgi:hypothetical protein